MAEPITLHTGGVYLVDGETVIPEECALEAVESTLEFPDPDVAREGTIAYGILAEHNTSGDMAHLKLRFDAWRAMTSRTLASYRRPRRRA